MTNTQLITKTQLTEAQEEVLKGEAMPPKTFPVISSEEQLSRASAYLSRLKGIIKTFYKKQDELLESPKKIKREVDLHMKFIKGEFAQRISPWEFAESCVKEQVLDFYTKQEKKAIEEAEALRKKSEEEAKMLEKTKTPEEKAELENFLEETKTLPVIAPKTKVTTGEGTTYVIKKWTFDIISPAKIPHEYLMIDEAKIKKAIASGVREISGVKIFEESSIGNRPT